MYNFYILSLISLVCFILGTIFLALKKYRKVRYNIYFSEDTLLEERKDINTISGILRSYSPSKRIREYIKKYLIINNLGEKALVCNYRKRYKNISYDVVMYNRKKKVINTINIYEENTSTVSKPITLEPHTKYVNIYVLTVDNTAVSSSKILLTSNAKITIYGLILGSNFFFFLLFLRNLFLFIFYKDTAIGYVSNSVYNYITLGLNLTLAVIIYFVVTINLKRRNRKLRRGGNLGYEYF